MMGHPRAHLIRLSRDNAWRLYLMAGALVLILYYLVPPFKGSGLLFNAIGLSSGVAILVGLRMNAPSERRAWLFFAAGQFVFVAGDAFYYGYDAVFHKDVPFPSVGDFFYLAVYPAIVAGLLILIRRRSTGGNRNSLIDALILTIGLALLSWVFLISPYTHDASLGILEKVVSIAYPAMDVLLLAVAIRLSVDGGLSRPSLRLLVLSTVCLLTTDAILGLLTLNGGYQEGGLLDTGWAAYYLLWGAAALHSSMRGIGEPVPDRHDRVTWRRLAMLTAASLTAPAVQAIQALRGAPLDLPVMVLSSAALFCLVVARMAGLVRGTERSALREKSLREAARALVGATSRDEVRDAALRSMLTLAGRGHDIRLTYLSPNGQLRARYLDEDGERVEWSLKASDMVVLDARQLRGRGSLLMDLDGSPLRQSLQLPAIDRHAMAFPLFFKDQLRGLVFVAGPEEFPTPMRNALQTLTVQISLALESAILTEDLHRRTSEARFQSLVQNASDVIMVVEPDLTLKYVSPSVERVLGYKTEALQGRRLTELLHPHEEDKVAPVLGDAIGGPQAGFEMVECRLRHYEGTWLHFEILRTNLLGDPNVSGVVLNARDVSERKEFEQQLRHQAFHDPVTNLANRALFADRVQHALARQTRDAGGLAVIFIDLDDFKVINDSLGHAAGDKVLAEVGRTLNQCVRTMDTVARFGGDEFAVLLEDTQSTEEVAEIADRILEALEGAIDVDGKEVYIRASMGMAILEGEDAMTSAADELMRNADVAMYMAKREGKGHYRVFEPEMHASVVERLELKGSLQRAIERGELEVHYQPIIEIPGERVAGFEALVRWKRSEGRMVSPADFIPLAEETGLIVPLGGWVLKEACRQARFLQDMFPTYPLLTMSVNLSAKQLSQPGLVAAVEQALTEFDLDPATLTLEMTESVLMSDTEVTLSRLQELKRLGVRIALDDFGTGYSSLSYLSRFPVDVLKIDRSFVNTIDGEGEESALAAAIVKLGEALHLRTVAEGIELPAQLDRLVELGCVLGQGFYFGRPMHIDALIEYLSPNLTGSQSKDD
jgi:diguanylate cyclase (GGDEF)-like protein/PAS domain S-box-containing protein